MPRSGVVIDIDRALGDKRLQRAGCSVAGIWLRCLFFLFSRGRRGSWTTTEAEAMDSLAVSGIEWDEFKRKICELEFGKFTEHEFEITITAPKDIYIVAPLSILPEQIELFKDLPQDVNESDLLKEKRNKPPYKAVVDLYNEICCDSAGLPKCKKLTGSRIGHIRKHWAENPNLEWWKELFTKVSLSGFLTGKVKTKTGYFTSCSLDFILEPQKTVRILEGVYDDRSGQGSEWANSRRSSNIEDQPGGKNYKYE